MRYDLPLICELCDEIGLPVRLLGDDCAELDLGQGALLQFQNAEDDKDCLAGFFGTPWHTHDNFLFGGHGYGVELDYLDLVVALTDGRILICEQRVNGQTMDRWLIHNKYNDEFKYLEVGEEIIVRRATIRAPKETPGTPSPG